MRNALLVFFAVSAAAQAASPVDALTKLLADNSETVQADVSQRLFDFLWSKAKETTFIPAKRRRKDPALAQKIHDAVGAWVKQHAPTGEAAAVFYVLGTGDKVPAWAQADALLRDSLSGYRTQDLIKKMAPWTEDSSGLPGQLSKKHAAEWPAAFLTDAASQARRFLDHRPIQGDKAFEREGKVLSGQREPPQGEVELMRFNKATDLITPPVPKMLKNVGAAVEAIPTAPLHKEDSSEKK